MSHEIRTPINAIIGLGALALRKDDMGPQAREHLVRIDESARSLLRLINEVLDMGRIESGRLVLASEPFALEALVQDIDAATCALVRDRGLAHALHVDPLADGTYVGDEARLAGAIASMLSYAAGTAQEGCVLTCTVEVAAELAEEGVLRVLHFVVEGGEATAGGASPEAVFEPFGSGAGAPGSHSGLGMAIAKQVVELMGGSVSVSAREGSRLRFDVTVPLAVAEPQDAGPESAIDVSALRVLAVDDDPIQVEHAVTVLEEAGVHAEAATGGEEALSMLEDAHGARRPYNLVLMDWSMPHMSGLECAREIRERYEDEVTVVAMTSFTWADIRDEAHVVGVETYLEKPLFAEDVLEQLKRIALRDERLLAGERRRADLVGRTILLAEDMEINAEIMIETLELEGIKADHAKNGRVAVEMFAESPCGTYAAILMDVRMPEMDGLEATRAIRSMERTDAARVPIIALTANTFDEDVEHSLSAGMNAHLSKPVESTRLIRVLGELVFDAASTTA